MKSTMEIGNPFMSVAGENNDFNSNLWTHIMNVYESLWNCSQVNATQHLWQKVNIDQLVEAVWCIYASVI